MSADGSSARVPRRTRLALAVWVIVLCLSPLFIWEPWPLTSWRLFSHERSQQRTSWEITAVGSDASTWPYPMNDELRGFDFQIVEFPELSDARRDELCVTWTDAAPAGPDGSRATRITVERLTWDLGDREGDRGADPSRELVITCDRSGVAE